MRIFNKLLLSLAFLLAATASYSQELFPAVQRLKNYCDVTPPIGYSPHLGVLTLTPKGNIHYLFPLYHGFRDEKKFRQIYSDKGYYDEMSQYFAFAGDYETALQYLVKSYDTIDDATAPLPRPSRRDSSERPDLLQCRGIPYPDSVLPTATTRASSFRPRRTSTRPSRGRFSTSSS